jgi:pimeloyl-ACP methyl ester carboxylesterase
VLEVDGLPEAAEVRPPKQRLMTMKCLTKIITRESRPLTFGWQVKRTQVLLLLVLAILLSGPPAALSRFSLVTNKSLRPYAVNESFVSVGKLRVRYIESGTGPTIVMIHGNAGSVEDFEFRALGMLAPDYHVIAVDRPGHGRSDRPGGQAASVEYQARLLHDVLSSLGVTRPVLVGHSWGASLALCYALQYPGDFSGLILMAPAAYPDRGESRLLQSFTKPPFLGDVALIAGKSILGKHVLRATLERAFYPEPIPRRYFELVAASWLGRKQLKAYLEDEASLNASLEGLSKRYSEIDAPVVIITGDQDQIVSAKDNAYRLQATIANSQLITLKDTGHEIPQTHPESIYEALNLIRKPMEGGGDGSQR